jgi:glycine C-acetyltransferase
MRSQTYAKSLPMPMVIGGLKRLELIRTKPELKVKLWTIVENLQKGLRDAGFDLGRTNTAVTPVFMKGGVNEATNLVFDLRENYGIFCSMVVYPVIPKGEIILRLMPTAMHTLEDVEITLEAFKKVREKLENGKYSKTELATVKVDM